MTSELTNTDGLIDQRDGPRKSFQRRALLSFGPAPAVQVRTLNLSTGGISVFLDRPLPNGTECDISVRTFIGDRLIDIRARCRVMYSVLSGMRGFRIGFHFIEKDSATDSALKSILGKE